MAAISCYQATRREKKEGQGSNRNELATWEDISDSRTMEDGELKIAK